MLAYERIDISDGIDVNKSDEYMPLHSTKQLTVAN